MANNPSVKAYELRFQEIRYLDMFRVCDVRVTSGFKPPKQDQKLKEMMTIGCGRLDTDASLTVVYATDFINLNFINFSPMRKGAGTAQVN